MLISVSTLSIFNPVDCILSCVRCVDDFTFIPASAQHWSPHTICSLFVIPSYLITHKTWWVPTANSVAVVLCFNSAFNPFTHTIFLVLPACYSILDLLSRMTKYWLKNVIFLQLGIEYTPLASDLSFLACRGVWKKPWMWPLVSSL